jgi:tetratricopeptide (TPR) repeat protein
MLSQLTKAVLSGMVVVAFLAVSARSAVAAEDDELKQQALKFNSVVIIGDTDGERAKFVDKQLEPLKKTPEKAKKLLAVASKLAQEKNQPFNYTGAYLLGVLAREVKDQESAKTFLGIAIDKAEALQSDQKLANAYFELIDMHLGEKNYASAERVCKEFLEKQTGPESLFYKVLALTRIVRLTAVQGKIDEANKHLATLLKVNPDSPLIVDTQAWLLKYQGKYDEAVKAYEKLLKSLEGETAQDTIHYYLSSLYADMGNVDKATEHLQILIKKEPDNSTYNNDLGYIWADHDRNLDEAEKMIAKAVKAEPDNAAYLDSMAWVLYKKKDYKQAKEYMQKALQDTKTRDMTLYDHLGDIHWALDEKADAVSAWKKAIDMAEKSTKDQKHKGELEKKLKEKQP